MKRNKVNLIFIDAAKRRKKIILYSFGIIMLLVLSISFGCFYFTKSKNEYVSYTENSKIDYKVYLKDNDFFEKDYAEEEKQYIASLIKYISADFKYDIEVAKDDVDFKYLYYVDAEVNVKEKGGTKSLYGFTESLLTKKEFESNGESSVSILQNIRIDYNRYNELIKDFIKTYKLDNTESTLTVKMYVQTIGECQDFVDNPKKESVISLVIPLTTKTMAIDISDDLVVDNYNILLCKENQMPVIYLLGSGLMFLTALSLVVSLLLFIVKSRTPKDIYRLELKKILSNYHTFIQKVNSKFDLRGYQVLSVDTFTDMLEIHDTLGQPILMVENKDKNGVHFIIPSSTKILYVYTLKEESSLETI